MTKASPEPLSLSTWLHSLPKDQTKPFKHYSNVGRTVGFSFVWNLSLYTFSWHCKKRLHLLAWNGMRTEQNVHVSKHPASLCHRLSLVLECWVSLEERPLQTITLSMWRDGTFWMSSRAWLEFSLEMLFKLQYSCVVMLAGCRTWYTSLEQPSDSWVTKTM